MFNYIPRRKRELLIELQDMLLKMDIVVLDLNSVHDTLIDLVKLNDNEDKLPDPEPLRRTLSVIINDDYTSLYYLLSKRDLDFDSPSCKDVLEYSKELKKGEIVSKPTTSEEILQNLRILFCQRDLLLTPEQGLDFKRYLRLILSM